MGSKGEGWHIFWTSIAEVVARGCGLKVSRACHGSNPKHESTQAWLSCGTLAVDSRYQQAKQGMSLTVFEGKPGCLKSSERKWNNSFCWLSSDSVKFLQRFTKTGIVLFWFVVLHKKVSMALMRRAGLRTKKCIQPINECPVEARSQGYAGSCICASNMMIFF